MKSEDSNRSSKGVPSFARFQKLASEYLKNLDYSDLEARMQAFNEKDLDKMDDDALLHSFREVVYAPKNPSLVAFFSSMRSLDIYSGRLLRVRNLPSMDESSSLPFTHINKDEQTWEPPAEKARLGRFNTDGVPLLYALTESRDEYLLNVACQEARTEAGDCYAAIIYYIKSSIKFINLHTPYESSDFEHRDEDKEKVELLNSFLAELLSKRYDGVSDSVYRMTNTILNNVYKPRDNTWDGWLYPSSYAQHSSNVALLPARAREKLEVQSITIYQSNRDKSLRDIPLYGYVGDRHSDGSLKYLDLSNDSNRQVYETAMANYHEKQSNR